MKKILCLVLSLALVISTLTAFATNDTLDVEKKGDANNDGAVDITDIVMIRSHIVGMRLLTDDAFALADVNGDNLVDIIDVAMVRSAIVNSVSPSDVKTPDSLNTDIELENKEIKWLCWDQSWTYGTDTPEGKLFADTYGGYVTAETCSYDDRYNILSQKISSGNSPDMFPLESDNYLNGVINGMFKPMDDYLDISGSEWDCTRSLMEKFVIDGKHYVILPYSEAGDFLAYNRDTIKKYGFEDPWKLFKEGKWDWNAMYNMLSKYCDADNDRYGIGGWWPERMLVATTGTPFVSLGNGHLKNNINSANVSKAMNFLGKLYYEGLDYPWEKFDWGKKINFIKEGKMLFYATGVYDLNGTFLNQRKTSAYCPNVFIVPFPKDPDADKYYQHLGIDAHMLVAGAKNPEGVAVWQNVRRAAQHKADIISAVKQSMKNNYNFSDELIEALDILEGQTEGYEFEPVYDFYRSINNNLITDVEDVDETVMFIEMSTYKMGYDWNEVLNYYGADVQRYLDTINGFMDKAQK